MILSKKPIVVVLLAAYNGADFIIEQIDSILSQNGVLVELIVQDDCSSDITCNLLVNIANHDDRVSLIRTPAPSGSAATNFLSMIADLEIASAPFDAIALADQDDLWHPDKLARACEVLEKSQSDGYSSNVTAFWPGGQERLIDKAQPQQSWDFLFESPGPGCTFVMTQKLALHLQSFIRENEQVLRGIGFHDWLIYAFARAHGYRWYIDPVPSMHYRQHDNNQFGANAGMASFVKRARGVLEGWWLRQSILTAQLVGLGEHPFVRRWSSGQRLGLAWLALQARHCRRKRVHQWLFALSCLVLALRLPGRGGKT